MASAQGRHDRVLGRELWKLLHIVAVNFPDGSKDGLSQQRLKGYYEFFNSLQYVLPRATWRDTWRHITSGGDTELGWTSFQSVRDHRQLSRWLFGVHDAVREDLKQPKSKVSYAKLYAGYRKFRAGSRNTPNTSNAHEDREGIEKLKVMLRGRGKALDAYLEKTYGSNVATWTRVRKEAMRKSHIDDAAKWYWLTMSNRVAKIDASFDALSNAQRRNRILTQFNFNYRLRPQRIANAIMGLPGALKNKIIS